jgi:hypothetical protein
MYWLSPDHVTSFLGVVNFNPIKRLPEFAGGVIFGSVPSEASN